MEGLRFNTAIAKLIELTNHLMKSGAAPATVVEPLVLMLAPLAPHLAEELWQRLGHPGSLAWEPFPEADPALLVESSVEVGVSVNGKPRGRVRVAAGADDTAHEAAARAEPKVAAMLDGRAVRKVVVVPGRLVNFVVAWQSPAVGPAPLGRPSRRLGLATLQGQPADAHDLPWPDEPSTWSTCRYGSVRRAPPRPGRGGRVLRTAGGSASSSTARREPATEVPYAAPSGAASACAGRSRSAEPGPSTAAPARCGDDLRAAGFSRRARERSERVEGCWSGSGAQVWQIAATVLPARAGRSGPPSDASSWVARSSPRSKRHRRGKVLHLPIHVHLATATKPDAR